MNDIATMHEDIRAGHAAFASSGFPDLCTLIPAALQTQGDGHTLIEGTAVPSIPCTHEQLGGGGVTVNDNGTVAVKTHKVDLPYTSDTKQIDRHYKIKVAARGFNPELIFEQPVKSQDSLSPFLTVFVTLAEGYARPGVR